MADLEIGGTQVILTNPQLPEVLGAPATAGGVVVPVPGPRGPSGSSYLHTQSTPAAQWTVTHGLGGYPPVTVLVDDDPTRAVFTDVDYLDADTLLLTFPAPVSGRAYV